MGSLSKCLTFDRKSSNLMKNDRVRGREGEREGGREGERETEGEGEEERSFLSISKGVSDVP